MVRACTPLTGLLASLPARASCMHSNARRAQQLMQCSSRRRRRLVRGLRRSLGGGSSWLSRSCSKRSSNRGERRRPSRRRHWRPCTGRWRHGTRRHRVCFVGLTSPPRHSSAKCWNWRRSACCFRGPGPYLPAATAHTYSRSSRQIGSDRARPRLFSSWTSTGASCYRFGVPCSSNWIVRACSLYRVRWSTILPSTGCSTVMLKATRPTRPRPTPRKQTARPTGALQSRSAPTAVPTTCPCGRCGARMQRITS